MPPQEAERLGRLEHPVGKYVCPTTKVVVPLLSSVPLVDIEWPLNIEHCSDCGQGHVLLAEDVWHPPIYGFE